MEGIPDQRERCAPDGGAQQAPGEKGPQAHARGPGKEWGDRPHDADEAPQQDRLGAVVLEEALDALEAPGGHAKPGAAGEQEAPPKTPAEAEAREVSERRGQPGDREYQPEADLTLRRHHPAERDGRLARRHQADEGAGLEKREAGHEGVSPAAKALRDVREQRLEIGG